MVVACVAVVASVIIAVVVAWSVELASKTEDDWAENSGGSIISEMHGVPCSCTNRSGQQQRRRLWRRQKRPREQNRLQSTSYVAIAFLLLISCLITWDFITSKPHRRLCSSVQELSTRPGRECSSEASAPSPSGQLPDSSYTCQVHRPAICPADGGRNQCTKSKKPATAAWHSGRQETSEGA